MPTDFQRRRISFPSRAGFAQSQDATFDFPSNIVKAESFINGFAIGFTQRDHPLFREQVNTTVDRFFDSTVVVTLTLALRDSSGVFDDAYDGWIEVVVIVNRV